MSVQRFASSSLLRVVRSEAPSPSRLSILTPRVAIQSTRSPLLFPRRPLSTSSPLRNVPQREEKKEQEQEEEDDEEAQKAKKGTIRERLRYLTRRYGWWALGVYMAASAIDFGIIFASIHMLGADHIRQLEQRVRNYVGLEKRDDEQEAEENKAKKQGTSAIWTEAVLAYTIHKTLLLPFRVAFTAAVTPSFVKYMAKMDWARSHAAVKKATEAAAKKKAAAAAAKQL